jgi:hypothetical protein
MVNRDFINQEDIIKIDDELFKYFTYFSLIKGFISATKQPLGCLKFLFHKTFSLGLIFIKISLCLYCLRFTPPLARGHSFARSLAKARGARADLLILFLKN